jgi:hypothetical protein
MNRKNLLIALALCCVLILGSGQVYAGPAPADPTVALLASGLAGGKGSGSTIGPDGALYVTEGEAGRISRVDPWTGAVTTFASGLPAALPAWPIGGPMDVAFLDGTAYALVTMVASDLGGSDIVGIYRIDSPTTWTVVADLGQWAIEHPPAMDFEYFIPTGVPYAMQPFRGGFLVTDGHLNRVLWVGLDGTISQVIDFGDVVPTGLAVHGNTVYIAEAGHAPHEPADGKVVAFGFKDPAAVELASGARLNVDVEFGLGRTLYALSQGEWNGAFEGSPAFENTGALMQVHQDGTLSVVADGLDRPTSVDFIGNTAYVVTLGGEVWTIDDVSAPPYGVEH